ncbi:CPBP family intramembrane glutamic endopeptidase [uncultured Methanobrevibacter sp.]|uniref:CPBP family intramembrane glutamic endopeptidase n=1 Tax=uncultured Methanobrevibacter sp. TaxID=253161 RepID=UPI00260E42A6|nr:CPBP family intramembrane glutamic endopeptidase [uncultured Methanobrevibacter sp.]
MNIHEKFFSKIGLYYLIFAVSALIMQIIAVNVIGTIDNSLLTDFNVLTILSAICNYILPFPILYYLMKKIEIQKLEKESLSLKTFLVYISITLTLMWIGNIIGLAITSAIGTIFQTDITNPVQTLINSSDIWLNLLLISIIGPIFEEIFFRKFLIDRTIKYGARVSIIISAVIFGFFHGNISQFFYAFLLGGFFAYIYIKTGKIIYPIILHIIVNLMGSVVSLFVVESTQAIISNVYSSTDIAIVVTYVLIILLAFLIGAISLTMYKKAKFNGVKTQISLKNPLKTSLINPGMILLIIFFIAEIIYTLIY